MCKGSRKRFKRTRRDPNPNEPRIDPVVGNMSNGSPRLVNRKIVVPLDLYGQKSVNDMVAAQRDEVAEDGKIVGSLPCDFDHMYASMTDGAVPVIDTCNPPVATTLATANTTISAASRALCASPRRSELRNKHLHELLMLHLDLIDAQSCELSAKDKLIASLRQENVQLKGRLERLDAGGENLRSDSDYSSSRLSSLENTLNRKKMSPSLQSQNVNQGKYMVASSAMNESTIRRSTRSDGDGNSPRYNESFKIRFNTSGGVTTVKQEDMRASPVENRNDSRRTWEGKRKRKKEDTKSPVSRRKRTSSTCSAVATCHSDSPIVDMAESQNSLVDDGKMSGKKEGKTLAKKNLCLVTKEPYYTGVGEKSFSLEEKKISPSETCAKPTLETPEWRVHHLMPCYSMEGTENMDDAVYAKRHLKLEMEEKRRKRWDYQRMREQKHTEKLRQAQEKRNHRATCSNTSHSGPCPKAGEEEGAVTFWHDPSQIQVIEIVDELPVTAFGACIPKFTPEEFSLPWLDKDKAGEKSDDNPRTKRSKKRSAKNKPNKS